MKSIKYKILLNFCVIAAISIVLIGVVVSWKMNESIVHQSENLAKDMTARTYETLNLPHQTFKLLIQEDIRRSTNDLCKSVTLINNLESGRLKALQAELQIAGRNLGLDFAILLNLEGQIEASFPLTLQHLKVEQYLKSWEFGTYPLNALSDDASETTEAAETTNLQDAISRHDSPTLKDLGLSDRDVSGQGALSIVSASIVKNDFDEPLGICILGKLLNHYAKPLQHLNDIAGYASVIYLDTTPIAQAGFTPPGEAGVDLSTLQIPPEIQTDVYNANENSHQVLTLAGKPYLTACSALQSFTGEDIGLLCIGLPESQVTEVQQSILSSSVDARKTVQMWILGVGLISLLLFVLASLVTATRITTPIKQLSNIAGMISVGNFQQAITVKSHDEIGLLADSMRAITTYIQHAADVSQKLSAGEIEVHVTSKSEHDVFNQSFATTIQYIQEVATVAEKISNKDLQVEVVPKSEHDVLNLSLQRMVTTLQTMTAENDQSMAALERQRAEAEQQRTVVEQQNWLRTGQAELSEKMRGEQDLATLSKNIVTYLAKYVSAQTGIVYLAEEDRLHLTGSYAYTSRKGGHSEFQFGERLVGQAALEKEALLFTDIPEDYMAIGSGLGETVPRQILVVPFLYDGEVKGVVELGTVRQFTEIQREFLHQIQENIAIAINSAQARVTMQALLAETQQQAEELQVQQEELREANEHLKSQTNALQESQEKLQVQQEELRQTNEELTEQTKALEQREKALHVKNAELEDARKVIEQKARDLELSSKYKSEFLANMSHELRTPLNSLLILSKLLADNKDGNLNDKQIEFADTIHGAGTELLELINEVLDLSKVEAGKMALNIEYMSLNGLCAYTIQNFQHVAEEKGIELHAHVADSLPASIRTDRQRVEQVIKNFLSNAVKFTEEGRITVSVQRPAAGTDLSHSGLAPDSAVAIAVSDTGLGIPAERQQLIFEAFQQADGTTSRKYGGTGLGLSLSRELVKLLGGEIHLHSVEGKGSTFTLYLPEKLKEEQMEDEALVALASEQETLFSSFSEEGFSEGTPDEKGLPAVDVIQSGVEAIWDDRHDPPSPTDKYLLIIEDDPKFAKIVFDLAREKGFKGLLAQDGEAGLQLAEQYRPGAIILDVGLPRMDGWTVMQKLKEHPDTRHIPVQFISARDDSMHAMKMGALGYLTKPVTIEKLEETFDTIEQAILAPIKNILIVEDDEVMQKSMSELISSKDINIMTATTGQDVYDLLKAQAFDCMVLDLGLGDISGFDLLDNLKTEVLINTHPIIVYTGKELTKDEELRLRQHAESIIIKGVKSPERLLDEVTLFLYRVESDLPESQQNALKLLHDKEAVLQDKTILLVDDDMRNVFALTSVLEEKGLTVIMCVNGKDALEELDTHPDIELVLMDIMMPEMDGYTAIQEIRKLKSDIRNVPIIALTAKAMKGDRQKCITAGANDYLSKPIDIERLLSLLRVWLY